MESLTREIEYLLKAGAGHQEAPHLGSDVLDAMDQFLGRFICYPFTAARHAHVLWIAHTWFMDAWDRTPRLLFVSPEAGSGKTRALEVTKTLVPRPIMAGDLSPAAFYQSIDDTVADKLDRPTILYDELDTVFGCSEEGRIRNSKMCRQINMGHDRAETVRRKVGTKAEEFQPYAALVLAGKMAVFDVPDTIRTRSVAIQMQRRLPDEKVERWTRRESFAQAEPIRELISLWAELVHADAHRHQPHIPAGVEDRDADVWEPLLTVGELAGGHWPERAATTAVSLVTLLGVKAVPSAGVHLLEDIRTIFEDVNTDRIYTQDLLARLRGLEASRWSALTPRKMAQLLSGYKIEPHPMRIGGRASGQMARGYERESFADAWLRYLPQSVTSETAVTSDEETNHG